MEVACSGGRGRTGSALACLAILDGVPGAEAVRYVCEYHYRRAVEISCQSTRRLVHQLEQPGHAVAIGAAIRITGRPPELRARGH